MLHEVLGRTLSPEQSGRAWKFAEILGRAIDLFGSKPEAEAWLERPAMALGQRKPIDLLSTPAGVESLEEHLTRIEYGVYM
jgi:putative toxin-antitoxin system antitoxin component (TIGR02293 family)